MNKNSVIGLLVVVVLIGGRYLALSIVKKRSRIHTHNDNHHYDHNH